MRSPRHRAEAGALLLALLLCVALMFIAAGGAQRAAIDGAPVAIKDTPADGLSALSFTPDVAAVGDAADASVAIKDSGADVSFTGAP